MSHITLTVEKKKLHDAKVEEQKSIQINEVHNHGNFAVQNSGTQQVGGDVDINKLLQLIKSSEHENKTLILDAINQYQKTKDATLLGKAVSYSADVATLLGLIYTSFTGG